MSASFSLELDASRGCEHTDQIELQLNLPASTVSPSGPTPPSPVRGILIDILLNTFIPVALYKLSKRYVSPSELTALSLATAFPLAKSIYELARHKQLDPVSLIVLLGIMTNGVALLLGGSTRLLLIRESLFTGVFGIACLISLAFPRPIMFYFGRYFLAGNDIQRKARFNSSWEFPEVRFTNRMITAVWGIVFVAELVIRVVLIYTMSSAWVLSVSPILLGALTIGTLVWAFAYSRRVRLRVQDKLKPIVPAGIL